MIMELGRLTKDVELISKEINGKRTTLLNNAIAISNGKDKTTFVNISAWGSTAEFISKHFKKGDAIIVIGELRNSTFDAEGKKYTTVYILLSNVQFSYGNKQDKPNTGKSEHKMDNKDESDLGLEEDVDDDDLPF